VGRGGIDGPRRERQQRRAVTPDAGGQAHGPARPGDQAEAELGQADDGVRVGDDASRECRQLDARAHACPVEVGGDAGGQGGQQPGRAAGQPDEVGGGRVGERAELVEVAARAEARAVAPQVDLRDGGIDDGERQRLAQLVPQPGVERVADLGPVEDDVEPRAVSLDVDHGRVGCGSLDDGASRPPGGELGTGLQGRIHGGLGDQAGLHGPGGAGPQQQGERGGGERRRADGGLDGGQVVVAGRDHDVDHVRHRVVVRAVGVGHSHDHRGEAGHPGQAIGRRRCAGVPLDDEQRAAGRGDVLGGGGSRQQVEELIGREVVPVHRCAPSCPA